MKLHVLTLAAIIHVLLLIATVCTFYHMYERCFWGELTVA